MDSLNPDILILIWCKLDQKSKWNLMVASISARAMFAESSVLMNEFLLTLNEEKFKTIQKNLSLLSVPFSRIHVNGKDIKYRNIIASLSLYKHSIQHLSFENLTIKNVDDLFNILCNSPKLSTLSFANFKINSSSKFNLNQISTLKSVVFHNCDENLMHSFENHPRIEKLTISNYNFTFSGFSHDKFNKLAMSLPNFKHLVLNGIGTSSYFDNEEFPFRIEILEADSVTFHWYIGIRTARIDFLKSQKGSLKELTIHKLPFDFDGARVLKYIIEDLKLNKFYYGKIPLILNGNKQEVHEFSASEIQIEAAFEMFRQFTSIRKFTLILYSTDICSDTVEAVINPRTKIFDNLEEFVVIDNFGLFGVFLGLYQNLRNIKKITFDTNDRNIVVILEESLLNMEKLEEIRFVSNLTNSVKVFEVIKNLVKTLKKITVSVMDVSSAKKVFENSRVEIAES